MSTDRIGERGERHMLQVPQVQQDLQQQQQALPSPVGGQQQPPHSQPRPQAQQQQQPQQLATANGSAMLMRSAPHAGSTPNSSFPAIEQRSTGRASDPQRAQQYSKQQRWLLFLCHASKCTASEGQCSISPDCHMAQQLWTHLKSCREKDCQYTRCNASRSLVHHHQFCTDCRCPVCGPVKQAIRNDLNVW